MMHLALLALFYYSYLSQTVRKGLILYYLFSFLVECPTYDRHFPSSHPSIAVYSDPKYPPDREDPEDPEKRRQHKELYRRWICLIEPYWTGYV